MNIPDHIYGYIKIEEPVLLELIDTPAMHRLKDINSNLSGKLIDGLWGNYTRFEHCIGVMHLIKRFGGDIEEQVAGLLHDVSHTAFSHAMDFAFGSEEKQDFHEINFEKVVLNSQIPQILILGAKLTLKPRLKKILK